MQRWRGKDPSGGAVVVNPCALGALEHWQPPILLERAAEGLARADELRRYRSKRRLPPVKPPEALRAILLGAGEAGLAAVKTVIEREPGFTEYLLPLTGKTAAKKTR